MNTRRLTLLVFLAALAMWLYVGISNTIKYLNIIKSESSEIRSDLKIEQSLDIGISETNEELKLLEHKILKADLNYKKQPNEKGLLELHNLRNRANGLALSVKDLINIKSQIRLSRVGLEKEVSRQKRAIRRLWLPFSTWQ